MAETPARTPLDTLVLRTPTEEARAFLMGCVSIRRALESHDGSWVGLPLRGSMPMFWAADGISEVEQPAVSPDRVVEMPVGTYHYVGEGGEPGVRSPSKRAKVGIVAQALSEAGVGEGDTLTLLDEVQSGGTIIQLARSGLGYARRHNLSLPLHIIAAEDTRVAAENRSGKYRNMSTNQREGVAASVVRLPLIACDKDNLLDKVEFVGENYLADATTNTFVTHRNTEAESLFRSLGSLARYPDLRNDDDFLRSVFDPMIIAGTETAGQFEEWATKVFALEHAA